MPRHDDFNSRPVDASQRALEQKRNDARARAEAVKLQLAAQGYNVATLEPVWGATQADTRAGSVNRFNDAAGGFEGFNVNNGDNTYTRFDASGNKIGTFRINRGGGGLGDALTMASHDIASNPALAAAITVAAAAGGIPPAMTAAALGLNRAGKDGNIQAGLETGVLSYGLGNTVGNFMEPTTGGAEMSGPAIEGAPGAPAAPPPLPPTDAASFYNQYTQLNELSNAAKSPITVRDVIRGINTIRNPIGTAIGVMTGANPEIKDYMDLYTAATGRSPVTDASKALGVAGASGAPTPPPPPVVTPPPTPPGGTPPVPGGTPPTTTPAPTAPPTTTPKPKGSTAYGVPLALLALLGAADNRGGSSGASRRSSKFQPSASAVKFNPFR